MNSVNQYLSENWLTLSELSLLVPADLLLCVYIYKEKYMYLVRVYFSLYSTYNNNTSNKGS